MSTQENIHDIEASFNDHCEKKSHQNSCCNDSSNDSDDPWYEPWSEPWCDPCCNDSSKNCC